ncbi:DUF5082 family protein [Bacillus sp. FJAT-47783]|uniref:YwqH-like family protein n=1 Tax=Bacillus sp. FJAT-47783 TaxID=2922712 RepID=UPI001FAD0676|nr:DUF5082 family protein [Bacillus sp. FJAT-47783]
MSYSDILYSLSQTISSQSADVDEKISRLKKAKKDLVNEQHAVENEWEKILDPDLGQSWTGNRADHFDKARRGAKKEIEQTFQEEVEQYTSQIQQKINLLEMQRESLRVASYLSHEAGGLLHKGEEAYAAIEHKFTEIRKRLL